MARTLPSLRRKPATREPGRRIIIFTEGSVTEPMYLRQLNRFSGNILISIQPQHGTPETLLAAAKQFLRYEQRRFDSASKRDVIWLVFDRDEHPNVPNVLTEAKAKRIEVGYSNPCFELWLLMLAVIIFGSTQIMLLAVR